MPHNSQLELNVQLGSVLHPVSLHGCSSAAHDGLKHQHFLGTLGVQLHVIAAMKQTPSCWQLHVYGQQGSHCGAHVGTIKTTHSNNHLVHESTLGTLQREAFLLSSANTHLDEAEVLSLELACPGSRQGGRGALAEATASNTAAALMARYMHKYGDKVTKESSELHSFTASQRY